MSELDNGATPAPSAVAASTPAAATPPRSASEALSRAASAASSPATQEAGATASPTPAGTPAGDTPSPDSITAANQPATGAQDGQKEAPQNRIEAAVRNARAEVVKSYGGLDPERVRAAVGIVELIQKDPRGLFEELGKRLGVTQATTPQANDDTFPEPDLQSEDGSKKAHSAANVTRMLDVQKRQIIKELAPLLGYVQELQQKNQHEALAEGAKSQAGQLLGEVREMPHFKEHEPAIADKLRKLNEEHPGEVQRIGVPAALYRCYNQVLAETVFPSIDKSAEERVRAGFNKKVATSQGSVHPSSVGGEGKKPTLNGPGDLARHLERLAGTLA